MALLFVAARWAKAAGRRLLTITVDHGLNPDSRGWNRVCSEAAKLVGADWIERRWEGDKPTTGLPAAARRARHALIADAAREAGAKVVLFAHTADDIAEGDWMRARGSMLGRLREWAPSPAWPEGRGLMLLRPMLDERRADLRTLLRDTDTDWIEDSANAWFTRGAARAALNPLPEGEGLRLAERSDAYLAERVRGKDEPGSHPNPSPFSARPIAGALGRPSPLPLGEGFKVDRAIPATDLAAVLLCASGRDMPPRRDHLDALTTRLISGEEFTATLSGARIEANRDQVIIGREPGELSRRLSPDIALIPDRPAIWDGRYEITAHTPGWTATAALGRLGALSKADRVIANTAPPWARAALPVLFRDGSDAPVLAWRQAEVRALAPRRLGLALGETTQESDLDRTIHGETPPPDLF